MGAQRSKPCICEKRGQDTSLLSTMRDRQQTSLNKDLKAEMTEGEQIATLEKELRETRLKLDRLEREQMYNFAERRMRALGNYENTLGKCQTAHVRLPINERTEDVTDSVAMLQCPKCDKQFTAEHHDILLRHLEEC